MNNVECQWEEPVTCSRCNNTQKIDSKEKEFCLGCGRHLVVYCKSCKMPNLRDSERCTSCRRQLHRKRTADTEKAKFKEIPPRVVQTLIVLTVALTFGTVYFIYNLITTEKQQPLPDTPVAPEHLIHR